MGTRSTSVFGPFSVPPINSRPAHGFPKTIILKESGTIAVARPVECYTLNEPPNERQKNRHRQTNFRQKHRQRGF